MKIRLCYARLMLAKPNLSRFRCIELFVAVVLASFTIPMWSRAAVVTVSGTMTSISDFGNDFRIGDQFDYSFTFDDQTLDTGVETYRGLFSAGLSAFLRTRE